MIAWTSTEPAQLPGTGPELTLYDTALQRKTVIPDSAGAGMYVCGITPYDATHMGHASTYVAFDLMNRYWRDRKAAVRYVQNVTDVDDPLLERATATGVKWTDLAQEQIDLFRADMEALNVLAPDHYVGAVESVDWIVPVVEDLLERGTAYRVPGTGGEPDGDVYFSIDAAADPADGGWWPGQVSHLAEEAMLQLSAERGGDPDRPGKRNRLDPLLWRAARDGEPSWDGAGLGRGRPGWHIECSVIAQKFLPSPFTVQAGGSDLAFPHHEMSAAHAWAATGTPLARHYAHSGMVGLDGEKMSKSRGNLVLVSRLRTAGEDPAAIRLAILAHHYRAEWSWTAEVLPAARHRLRSWRDAVRRGTGVEDARKLTDEVRTALGDDLDAPSALAAVDAWAQRTVADLGSTDGRSTAAGGSNPDGSNLDDGSNPAGGNTQTDGAGPAADTQNGGAAVTRMIDALLGVRLTAQAS